MNKAQIGGLVLFLVALAGFVIILPRLEPEPAGQPAEPEAAPIGNIPTGSSVNNEPAGQTIPADSVLRPAARPENSGRKGFNIEMKDLSGFSVGDEIALYIPQEDIAYSGTILDVEVTAAGNRIMKGFLDEAQRKNRFIFTVGQFQTFGTIQTDQGRYQLETRDGVGRIISTATINEGLDFTKPDYVIPDRRELPPEETVQNNN